MDELKTTGRCGWIALVFVMLLAQEFLPLGFILGMSGITNAFFADLGAASELTRRVLVLGGLIAGTMAPVLAFLLLAAGTRRLARSMRLWRSGQERTRREALLP